MNTSANETADALSIGPIEDGDVPAVIALWQRCDLTRPWNDPAADIALARRGSNSTILIGRDRKTVIATAMVGHEGHRGWVYYVAVDPDHRGKGHGRTMMNAAEDWLRNAGMTKLHLLVRPENTRVKAFYESIGYEEQPRIMYAKWLDGREATP